MALFSFGSTDISHLVILLSILRKIYQIHFHFIKALFQVLFFSFSTPLHSAHLYLIHLSNISMPMTLYLFSALDFTLNIAHLKTAINNVSAWKPPLSLNQSKTEFLLNGLPQQLSKVSDPTLSMTSNVTITPTNSARNLDVIFDSLFTFSQHISSVSKSCFLSIRDLRRIWNTLDYSSAQIIATSLIHSKIIIMNNN